MISSVYYYDTKNYENYAPFQFMRPCSSRYMCLVNIIINYPLDIFVRLFVHTIYEINKECY